MHARTHTDAPCGALPFYRHLFTNFLVSFFEPPDSCLSPWACKWWEGSASTSPKAPGWLQPGRVSHRVLEAPLERFRHAEADGRMWGSLIVRAGRKFSASPPAPPVRAEAAAGCRTLPPASCISGISCPCTPKAPSMASSAPWGESAVLAPRHPTFSGTRSHTC